MSQLPQLLLISAVPPVPTDSGGATRIFYTLKELSRYYDIHFITFNSLNSDFYKKYTKSFTSIPLQPKSLFTPLPYHFSPWYNPSLRQTINTITKDHSIDIVQIEQTQLLYLVNYLPTHTQKIFTAHDISTVSFYRRFQEAKTIIKKVSTLISWLQVDAYEHKYLSKFDKINTASTTDERLLIQKFHLHSQVIPNGIDAIDLLNTPLHHPIRLGYLGSFTHPPNRFAIDYFIHQIAPLLDSNHVDYEFVLAGNNNTVAHPKFKSLGFVKDIKDFYKEIDLLVAPIFSGSGTRLKILEALAFGVPVVTTPIGAEGLTFDSPYLQIANSPLDFKIKISDSISLIKSKEKSQFLLSLEKQLKPYLWQYIFTQT